MNPGILFRTRRWLLVLTVAACLAIGANFGQAALSHWAGVELTSVVYACQGAGSGC